MTTLSLRQLNRATLARQMLLERRRCTALDAVERLVGLQAQLPRPPFVGLWSRVEGFERDQLLRLIRGREVVRATTMRGTLHLMSARDFVHFRSALKPMLTAGISVLGERANGLDMERLVREAREILAERPRPFEEIRSLLVKCGLVGDERAMGFAVRMQVPLVQVPSGAAWGYDVKAAFALAEAWIGSALEPDASPHALVLRYLAAFGPAAPADVAVWSGLRGIREVLEVLRPDLEVFRDEAGRELFDLPDAPRPPADVEAPIRFLPEFDNLILSHEDRTRVLPQVHRPRILTPNLQVPATFLVDGFVAGTWRIERKRGSGILTLQAFGKLTKRVQNQLQQEGMALLPFVEEDARGYEVRFAESR